MSPEARKGKAECSPVNATGRGATPFFLSLPRMTAEVGVSTILGMGVGVASKRLTSDALYGTGLAFIMLQCLNYFGYISIDWGKVETDIAKVADQNGDNKLDWCDLKILFSRFIRFAGQGIGDMSGFLTGFFLGVRYLA
ncbi:hypothetical protein TRVL_00625 [Trypanosoma vivax]|uniref:EF-hand domain-containing protein n=1 Tax=Trypanosoma vivax (strain Y486) TaxID=1055687 RepID=G0TX80_TRYVY|nr:hypothetical protein TRVL_00625 [Trypanosoma vivax]CCC48570.1 conserved hypothetical protein [Trypanosoma vivax Y486]